MLLRSFYAGFVCTVIALFSIAAAPAGATVIGLSEMSSDQDEPNGTPPDALLANLEFVVTAPGTLELTVDNTFANVYGNDYDITDLYFNTGPDIVASSLAITSPPTDAGWALFESVTPTGPMLGTFDYHVQVTGDINTNTATVESGSIQTLTFSFSCEALAVCNMDDFVVDNAAGKAVAAKFQNGGEYFDEEFPGGNDSAFGASGEGFPPVPEPGTALLVGGGLIGLAYAGRRRS
jgi:hypothetical protein